LDSSSSLRLQVLNLSANAIDDDAGMAISQLITSNKTLFEIDLSFNQLTDRSATTIFQV